MKTFKLCWCFAVIFALAASALAAPKKAKLHIQHEPGSGRVIISWQGGKGADLAKSRLVDGKYERLRHTSSPVVIEPSDDQSHFQLFSGAESVVSENMVGYVNTDFPPGLSLKANPLRAPTNTLGYLMPAAPDGSQVYKFTEGSNYEVGTFDAVTMTWSNPDIDLSVGIGFFFHNPSSEVFVQTFVGEVRLGCVTNNLPAGFSTEGSLFPQAGSINTLHGIPGEPGDMIRLYVNDGQGGGDYSVSVFDGASNSWVPDLELGVAEGFWTHKQNAQDWVRCFNIFD